MVAGMSDKLSDSDGDASPMRRQPSGATPVFVYGSLLWQPVLQTLIGRIPRAKPVLLTGYERSRVKGARFPAIMEVSNGAAPAAIRGVLLEDLNTWEAAVLDAFEDDEYEKRLISAHVVPSLQEDAFSWAQQGFCDGDLQNGLQQTSALAYVWTVKTMLDILWQPSRDFVPHEYEYLVMCDTFVREELPGNLREPALAAGAGLAALRLSSRRSAKSYAEEIAGLFAEDRGKGPTSDALMRLSGLGSAIAVTSELALRLEADGIARIERISTDCVELESQGCSQARSVPQLSVYIVRQRSQAL
mmetsp:Transcript_74248/g.193344  ORF Transcript_74248/g.193344 Transcript_74248/m.193344 type:complete len:302 (-) Transcript_74248:224-1129(-)